MGRVIAILAVLALGTPLVLAKDVVSPKAGERALARFVVAVEDVNTAHRRKPGTNREADLAKKLPTGVRDTLEQLLRVPDGEAQWTLLKGYAAAAADLDLGKDLARVEKTLRKRAPAVAAEVGHYISRERFLLHALRVSDDYAQQFADALDGILKAYDKTFGFAEFSKVPGKKIRVELHKEDRPRPPHFAPQYPFHSAIDFPVTKGDVFSSPTKDGRFLFYGLCHELGHLIAMWGDRKTEEDHHAWAHYTGVVIVDACEDAAWAKRLRDQRWRSLDVERKKYKSEVPSAASRDGVMKMLIELHEAVGPKRIGAALNHMDAKRFGHRINHVRYYGLRDFEKALLSGKPSKRQRKRVQELFEDAPR